MSTRHPSSVPVTPADVFLDRRQLLRRLGLGGLAWAAGCGPGEEPSPVSGFPAGPFPARRNPAFGVPAEVERKEFTPGQVAAVHNNFYEFLPGRGGDLRHLVKGFATSPWRLEVGGACDRPRAFTLEDLAAFAHEERVYHFRCVERWAMNVPWTGFPLWRLLEQVAPRAEAAWVAFESASDPASMPGIEKTPFYPWPYREALRRDEAEHDLTLLATGVYGAPLPVQHGAPIRLVVPWKYGYKSAKSLVRIELREGPPETFWSRVAPHEYGLLSNVNPNIPHPRWGQELSFWLRDDPVWPTGEDTFPTPFLNGYEAEVGALYPDEPRSPQLVLQPGRTAR